MLIPEATIAQLSVLTIGDGDMRLSFDSDDKAEMERAQDVVEDMLKRSYQIFVEVDGKLERTGEQREEAKVARGAMARGGI